MYLSHPSKALQAAFLEKPYQGADPEAASLIFVGLDANYSETIERERIFRSVLEYHSDGPAYWKRTKRHHPFLEPGYNGAGLNYHRNFAQIGFSGDDAETLSFVELIAVPTVGRSALTVADLDPAHLGYLRKALFEGERKLVFVSPSVAALMNKSGAFPTLRLPENATEPLPLLFQFDDAAVYRHLHFSVYGKFEHRRLVEAAAIRRLANTRIISKG